MANEDQVQPYDKLIWYRIMGLRETHDIVYGDPCKYFWGRLW